MAAPNPMGISECAGTVKEVMRDLRKGKGLPTCKLVSSSTGTSGTSYVSYRRASLTPRCPEGTNQASDGILYHQGRRPNNPNSSDLADGVSNQYKSATFLKPQEISLRVCVGGQNYGQYITAEKGLRWQDNYVPSQTHQWFEKLIIMTPDGADYEFDVTIDGKQHSRHRFSL